MNNKTADLPIFLLAIGKPSTTTKPLAFEKNKKDKKKTVGYVIASKYEGTKYLISYA